jgi:hypothetical protein
VGQVVFWNFGKSKSPGSVSGNVMWLIYC